MQYTSFRAYWSRIFYSELISIFWGTLAGLAVQQFQHLFISLLVFRPYKECFEYNWLKDSSRNVKHVATAYLCDNGLASGWYRFGGGAGTKLATSCTPKHRCQTDKTGWMNGAHPTVADGKVKRKVCFSHDGSSCCLWSNYIEVINCGWYYVYKLGPPPQCNARYCGTGN